MKTNGLIIKSQAFGLVSDRLPKSIALLQPGDKSNKEAFSFPYCCPIPGRIDCSVLRNFPGLAHPRSLGDQGPCPAGPCRHDGFMASHCILIHREKERMLFLTRVYRQRNNLIIKQSPSPNGEGDHLILQIADYLLCIISSIASVIELGPYFSASNRRR